MSKTYQPTARTTVGRLPKRAAYDRAVIHAILDEGFLCHVGFVVDGQPYVIPTSYARVGEQLYLHGSAASRMLRSVAAGIDVCVTVTLLDGLVLARSVFHHSMNYRSVLVLGRARLVSEPAEKLAALRAFTNHILEDRWEEARQPTAQELKATSVLAVELKEVSAKVRSGPPVDDDEDYALPVWAGVVLMKLSAGEPIPDARNHPEAVPFTPLRATGRARSKKP